MILSGTSLYPEPVVAEGFLFVGDPHVSSQAPGRRLNETDWPSAVFRKLERCVEAANERALVPVCLGDLFHFPAEPDEAVKTRLTAILKRFWMPMVTNTGNHDKAGGMLGVGDSLALLGTSDVVDVVRTSGPALSVRIGERLVGLGMTPFGQEIPTDVSPCFPGHDVVVWLTHHDIAFAGAYPGAMQPFPVKGCAMVVNGHMHRVFPPVQKGGTTWYNPGNITRLSTDVADHVPRAWALSRGGRLEAVELPHEKSPFTLTGLLVDPIAPGDATRPPDADSAFVSLLVAEESTDLSRSHDGSIMREAIDDKFAADGTPQEVRDAVLSVLHEAVARRATRK